MDGDGAARLQGDPDLFVRIAENALVVAEELRQDYVHSTLGIARRMRDEFRSDTGPYRIARIPEPDLDQIAVAFIDGGISRVDLGIEVPLIVRAGIFRVKEGERDMEKRETFDHFPLMLGRLKGGLKANRDYPNVVRELIELGALVTALEDDRYDDIRLLMLHGPLQFVTGTFFEHWFYPGDYERMLGLEEGRPHVLRVLAGFTGWCKACSLQGTDQCRQDIGDQHLPAVCMMAFLQHYIFDRAAEKNVLLCGAIERSFGRGITRYVVARLLDKEPALFERILAAINMEGRGAGVQVDAILDATRYNDAVLLALALEAGDYLGWSPVKPLYGERDPRAALFPDVQSTFIRSASGKYPMRLEAPASADVSQLDEIVARTYEYASLLPNYAFPIGLDVADKFAAIPGWMTKAYRQMILAQYGRLVAGDYVDITETEKLQTMLLTRGEGRRARQDRPEV